MDNKDIYDVSGINHNVITRETKYWQNNTWVMDRRADKFLFPYVRDIYRGKILNS